MKIIVLNGSPKGQVSITMQSVHYLQKKFPAHQLKILNISQQIKRIEKDEKAFSAIIDEVKSSDGVFWAFPVYTFLVPSQYKRFIELIWERGVEQAFKGKYTAVLSTSKRIFDHTAHKYMNAICDDLGMRFVDFYSADMEDLLKEEERDRLVLFADCFFEAIENKHRTLRKYQPLPRSTFEYVPGKGERKIDSGRKKIIIVTDSVDNKTNLGRMIERFKQSFSGDVEVFNLHDLDIKGGCLGCMQCTQENVCVYQDEFTDFFDKRVKTADIIVFAATIQDRYFSAKHRQFFDRQFFNHHKPPFIGKQLGSIISGPAGQMRYLDEMNDAGAGFSRFNYVGCVTDESGDSAEIDAQLESLGEQLVRLAEKNYVKPTTFSGEAMTKILRDMTWGTSRFILPDDHKYYKENGLYDFPYKDFKTIRRNIIFMVLNKIPGFKKEVSKRIKTGMIMEHQKVVAAQ